MAKTKGLPIWEAFLRDQKIHFRKNKIEKCPLAKTSGRMIAYH